MQRRNARLPKLRSFAATPASRLRLAFIAAVALLVSAGLWMCRDRRPELVIAFVERNALQTNSDLAKRYQLFEEIHRRTFERLVMEWNAQKRAFRLRLLDAEPRPPVSDPSATIALRYAALARIPNLVMVFDNHWGAEISKVRTQLCDFPAPIVFLNADHDQQDFGLARFFVGNSDPVPSEIAALLPKLMEQSKAGQKHFVFVSEEDYSLTKYFQEAWRSSPYQPAATIFLPPINDEVRDKKRTEIANALRSDSLGGPGGRKLVVLNAHGAWGKALLQWLDQEFENITVVAYQSALSFEAEFTFGKHEANELILLSTSPQTIPEKLFLRFRELQREFSEPFNRPDAPFFVRRCVLAMDLCATLLRKAEKKAKGWPLPKEQALHEYLRLACADYRPGLLHSSFGQHRFTLRGEVLGQNQFLLHKNHVVSAFSYQPSYHFDQEEGLKLSIVRNAQVGIQDIRVRDINIQAGTFRAEFYYWVRVPKAASSRETENAPSLPVLKLIDYDPDSKGEDASEGGGGSPRLVADDDLGFLHQSLFRVSGTFRLPLNDWRYPFDRHRLKIELQSTASDRELHLSRETRHLDILGQGNAPQVNGWVVSDHYTAVNSRETNPIPVPFESKAGRSSQYDTIVVTFDVCRHWWSTLPLLWLPLLLLAGASLAVLYITFGETSSLNPAPLPANGDASAGNRGEEAETRAARRTKRGYVLSDSEWQALETLKTQTELSLGCTLAVITYLISYATLAPHIDTPTYADALVGFTLAFATINFIFVVAISQREHNRFFLALKPILYRHWATWVACLGLAGWLIAGIFLLPLVRAAVPN